MLQRLEASFGFTFHNTAEGLERSEEGNALDKEVELSRDDVKSHSLICNEKVVRDVLVDEMVEDYTGGMCESFLSILETCLSIWRNVWAKYQGLNGPSTKDLAKTDTTLIHVDFI